MTSAQKIAANRRNAARSTGPRTAQGKARASRNAFKHGLAASIAYDSAQSEEIDRLANAIAGDTSEAAALGLARSAAEAHLELLCARKFRLALLNTAIVMGRLEAANASVRRDTDRSVPSASDAAAVTQTVDHLLHLERYERRAFSRRRRLLRECKSQRQLDRSRDQGDVLAKRTHR